MHHPDIFNILMTIDDYFMLTSDDSKCQIEAIIDDEDEDKRGIKISRKISNGYIVADISNIDRDDDTVIFKYASDLNTLACGEYIEIESSDYSPESVRFAIRKILKRDKESAI